MLVLVTYDINTETKEGSSRLRRVAKKCQSYGQRVQNSVFECVIDATQYVVLKRELLIIINKNTDSLRFYRIGNKYDTKIEHYGSKETFEIEKPLIF